MKIKAHRQLVGSYGMVREGTIFDTDQETAMELMRAGLASPVYYETKVIQAVPVVTARSFRDVRDADIGETQPVVGPGDPVLEVADVPVEAPTSGKRGRGRPRKNPVQ